MAVLPILRGKEINQQRIRQNWSTGLTCQNVTRLRNHPNVPKHYDVC
jgi:hypothetical protein